MLVQIMIYRRSRRTKSCLNTRRKAVEFDPDEYQKFEHHRNVLKSNVSTHHRVPTTVIIIIIIKKDTHPISPKTIVPQYQPIDRKKKRGKKSRRL